MTRGSPETRVFMNPPVLLPLLENETCLLARVEGDADAECRWIVKGFVFEGCRVLLSLMEEQAPLPVLLLVFFEQGGRLLVLEWPVDRLPPAAAEGAAEEAETERSASGLRISVEPRTLNVLQDTEVTMEAVPPDGSVVQCIWDPGDQSPLIRGCKPPPHVFAEALTDRLVVLTVQDARGGRIGTWSFPLHLEKLPPAPAPETVEPAPGTDCGSDPECQRILVANAWNLAPGWIRALESAATVSGAGLVIMFFHSRLPDDQEFKEVLAATDRLGAGFMPLPCDSSSGALQALLERVLLKGPPLMTDLKAEALPYSFASQFKRLFLMFERKGAGLSLQDERRITAALGDARLLSFRLLLTCGALDRLGFEDRELFPSPYRIYEKLLRGDVNLVVSAAYPLFYPGTWGNVKVLAPGAFPAGADVLLGQTAPQEPSVSVLEFRGGRLSAILRLATDTSGGPPKPSSEALPEKVGATKLWFPAGR